MHVIDIYKKYLNIPSITFREVNTSELIPKLEKDNGVSVHIKKFHAVGTIGALIKYAL